MNNPSEAIMSPLNLEIQPRAAVQGKLSDAADARKVLSNEVQSSTSKEQVDYLWNIHKYKNDYIRFADTKAAFVITFCSALLAALYREGLHKIFLMKAPMEWRSIEWLALVSFIGLTTSIGCSVWAIRPRLSSTQSKGLIYWEAVLGHITADQFWDQIKIQTNEHLTENLAHHVYQLALLVKQKYFWVSISMMAAALAGCCAIITLIFR